MAWDNEWKRGPDGWYKFKHDGQWTHMLVSHLDTTSDQERDRNHIHVKFVSSGPKQAPVVCAIKVDGVRAINRRQMIDAINQRVTGLNLQYR